MASDINTHRTTIEIDVPAFEGAQRALGTAGYKETVNEALRMVSRGELLQRAARAIRTGELGLVEPDELSRLRESRA